MANRRAQDRDWELLSGLWTEGPQIKKRLVSYKVGDAIPRTKQEVFKLLAELIDRDCDEHQAAGTSPLSKRLRLRSHMFNTPHELEAAIARKMQQCPRTSEISILTEAACLLHDLDDQERNKPVVQAMPGSRQLEGW